MKKVLHLNSKIKVNKSSITNKDFYGAKHIVIEGVGSMIANTVMNGILYTRECIEDLANNTKGQVLSPSGHPTDEAGSYILAGTPEAIHQNYVGAFSYNYRMQGDRLIHDLAIDPEKASLSEEGKELLLRIENLQDIDTSTGLIVYEFEEKEGYGQCGSVFNLIANKIDLDHDAILLSEKGAATSKQGVGVFANSDNEKIEIDEFLVNVSIANESLDLVDIEFNEAEALERVKEFTESTKEPSSNFRRFFIDFDSKDTSNFSSYNYLFADIVDGKPVAIKQALLDIKAEITDKNLLDVVDRILSKEKKEDKKNIFGNAWNAIKSMLFNNDSKKESLHDKIYKAINKDIGDNCLPIDIKDNYFIYKKNDGNLYKVCYNIKNDELLLDGEAIRVINETVYKPIKESDEMKDLILKALADAGVDTKDMSDTELLSAFSKLEATAENAEAEEKEEKDEDKEVDATNEKDEKEDVQKLIDNAVEEAVAPYKAKLEANKQKEIDKLVDQVTKLDIGIDKETAKLMSVNAIKNVLSKNGAIAFNAEGGYNVKDKAETNLSDMPD